MAGHTFVGWASPPLITVVSRTNDYSLVWTNPPVGPHLLTVHAPSLGWRNETTDSVAINVHTSTPPVGSFSLTCLLGQQQRIPYREITAKNYNFSGPLDSQTLIPGLLLVGSGSIRYTVYNHDILEVPLNGTNRVMHLPSSLPPLSWPTSAAYDAERDRVIISSLGGEGYFYSYSPTSNRWSVLASLQNRDLAAITYRAADDSIYGVSASGSDGGIPLLHRFDSEGNHLNTRSFPRIPFGLFFGNYNAVLTSTGDYIVLLLEAKNHLSSQQDAESRIYVMNLQTGETHLTYRKIWEQWPLPPEPHRPLVQFTSPWTNTNLLAGSTLRLMVQVTDPLHSIAEVNFMANGQTIGYAPYPVTANFYSYHWSNLVAGTYAVSANAIDNAGNIGVSQTIIVTVTNMPPPPPVPTNTLFQIYHWVQAHPGSSNGTLLTADWTIDGPARPGSLLPGILAVSDHDENYYAAGWHTIWEIDMDGTGRELHVPSNLPELSWPMGVAYDTSRDRVVVASLGGEGYLYAYSPLSNSWTLLASMENRDIDNLVHHPQDDHFYGVEIGANRILRFNANGIKDGEINLPHMPNLSMGASELISYGNKLLLILQTPNFLPLPGAILAGSAYLIDPATGAVELIYHQPSSTFNIPPTVNLVSPAPGTVLNRLQALELSATATDDHGIHSVQFFNGHNLLTPPLTRGTNGLYGTNLVYMAPGQYLIRAVALDSHGLASTSSPVTVSIFGDPFPTNSLGFTLLFHRDLGVAEDGLPLLERHYTLNGPSSGNRLLWGTRLVSDGTAQNYYGVRHRQLTKFDNTNQLLRPFPLPSHLPHTDWIMDVTYDQYRDSLLVTTLEGTGYIYNYNLQSNLWSTLTALDGVDYEALVHHPHDNVLYGFTTYYMDDTPPKVVQLFHDGTVNREYELPHLPFKVGPGYHQAELVAYSDKVVLLIEPENPETHHENVSESRMYVIQPDFPYSVELTYRKIWTNNPPLPRVPLVKIVSPLNGSTNNGASVRLVAEATDDEQVVSVGFYNGGTLIGTAEHTQSNRYEFVWQVPAAGIYAVTARARDNDNLQSSSTLVQFRVIIPPVGARRDLPPAYHPAIPFEVKLLVQPRLSGHAYALEDRPPIGWTVSEISDGGEYDALNRKVKWGPFFGTESRTLTYIVTPPALAHGLQSFTGMVSTDGHQQGITGDLTINSVPARHPADRQPADNRITINELTDYAAAWKNDETWPLLPNPIPLSYVTAASFIWKNGETYTFLPTAGPAPHLWVPTNSPVARMAFAQSTATRSITMNQDGTLDVTLQLHPATGVTAYAVEEELPPGATLMGLPASNGTITGNKIKFGPFFDAQPRTLSYTIQTDNRDAALPLFGKVSFDGSDDLIGGQQLLSIENALRIERGVGGQLLLRFTALPNQNLEVQFTEDFAGEWTTIDTINSGTGQGAIALPTFGANHTCRFYRIKPAAP
ncbi:MAG: Ig-like domain-containing protein [Verrucomicrobiota bacterium]|nr:Ig-like domain-containing protein [Verrucomicrobiota bacterium]